MDIKKLNEIKMAAKQMDANELEDAMIELAQSDIDLPDDFFGEMRTLLDQKKMIQTAPTVSNSFQTNLPNTAQSDISQPVSQPNTKPTPSKSFGVVPQKNNTASAQPQGFTNRLNGVGQVINQYENRPFDEQFQSTADLSGLDRMVSPAMKATSVGQDPTETMDVKAILDQLGITMPKQSKTQKTLDTILNVLGAVGTVGEELAGNSASADDIYRTNMRRQQLGLTNRLAQQKLYTDVAGDLQKKKMEGMIGNAATREFQYYLGLPEDQKREYLRLKQIGQNPMQQALANMLNRGGM